MEHTPDTTWLAEAARAAAEQQGREICSGSS